LVKAYIQKGAYPAINRPASGESEGQNPMKTKKEVSISLFLSSYDWET